MIEQSNQNREKSQEPDVHATGQKKNKEVDYGNIEKDLNQKILEITMEINEKNPELLKYLEEMPVTIPIDMNPEMKVKQLLSYYESLCAIMDRYESEQPNASKEGNS